MRDFLRGVRLAFRFIVKNRTLTLTVFLSLALGIGATASIFSLVDSFLVRPLSVPETGRVVRITWQYQSVEDVVNALSG